MSYRQFGASDLITISRDAWNDLQGYVQSLEREVDHLKEELADAENTIYELEEKLNG